MPSLFERSGGFRLPRLESYCEHRAHVHLAPANDKHLQRSSWPVASVSPHWSESQKHRDSRTRPATAQQVSHQSTHKALLKKHASRTTSSSSRTLPFSSTSQAVASSAWNIAVLIAIMTRQQTSPYHMSHSQNLVVQWFTRIPCKEIKRRR